jgi:hypothetical protein
MCMNDATVKNEIKRPTEILWDPTKQKHSNVLYFAFFYLLFNDSVCSLTIVDL